MKVIMKDLLGHIDDEIDKGGDIMKVIMKDLLGHIDDEIDKGGDIHRIEVDMGSFIELITLTSTIDCEVFLHVVNSDYTGSYIVYRDVCIQTHRDYPKGIKVIRPSFLNILNNTISSIGANNIKKIKITKSEWYELSQEFPVSFKVKEINTKDMIYRGVPIEVV